MFQKENALSFLFMALNRAEDMSAADWLIRFFSVVEIPIKQSNLYHKGVLFMSAWELELKRLWDLCCDISNYKS